MSITSAIPNFVQEFVALIKEKHETTVEIREILTSGKSGAFVGLVDCVGKHDGVFILKIDNVPTGWEDEETRHRDAVSAGAFSGRVPSILLSERKDTQYCLVVKLAGESRLTWRPLVDSLKLFRSAYIRFAEIAWTPKLFSFAEQMSSAGVVRNTP